MASVLIVEDSKFLKIANERILSKAGYHVLGAGDGEEALRIAGETLPDVILLDMMLPKMGGPEVLQSLKRNPATAQIPVIILTSLSQKNEGKLRQAGAFSFVEKGPLLEHPQLLIGAVELALKNSGNERPAEPPVQNLAPLRGAESNENRKAF
jgi:CheY-like chemotaxis protein